MSDLHSWYALYTMPRWEKKVNELLLRKDIITYCPLNHVEKQWHDRRKIVQEPLFRSYVFVRLTERQKLTVQQTPGVINFVYWLGKPAVIRNEEIETIKKFLNDHPGVELEKTEVEVNNLVRVISGPLMEQQGIVQEVNNNSVKVNIPSLGFALVAKLDRSAITVVYREKDPVKDAK